MGNTTLSNPLPVRGNRRETILLISTAAVLLTALAAVAMLGLYAVPERPLVAIGNVRDFPHGMPPRLITVDNHQIFIVTLATEIIAFEPMVDYWDGFRWPVKWVPSTNRFEDALGGSKFWMDGRWIEGPAPRNLDRYPLTIDSDGTIRIETWRTIKGDTHPCTRYRTFCR